MKQDDKTAYHLSQEKIGEMCNRIIIPEPREHKLLPGYEKVSIISL